MAINYISNQEAAVALAEEINAAYGAGTAAPYLCDISDEAAVISLFEVVATTLGGVDLLVNNAAWENTVAAVDMPMSDWDHAMGVNLRGAFICARQAARGMRLRKRGGVIVNISSMHDKIARTGAAHYCASKAGLSMLTNVLALEFAEYGIRVVGVAPGAIRREEYKRDLGVSLFLKIFNRWIPLKRVGECDEVAEAVAFLASDAASYITGTTLDVDGGYSINLVRYDGRKLPGARR
jgi:NAD(P)-dependent dehydrogenase (short-subunit alcohol dehydrogenase family)